MTKKIISHQSGNEIVHNSNADKSSHVRDIDPDLQDVEGIGPTTAKKLKEAGITSVMELAVTTIEQLAVDINFQRIALLCLLWRRRNCLENRMY